MTSSPLPPPSTEQQDDQTELDLAFAEGAALVAGSRGRPKKAPVEFHFVREMTEEDVKALESRPVLAKPAGLVTRLKTSHHKMAQLCAQGFNYHEIASITGYSPQYVSDMATANEAFIALVEYYGGIEILKQADHMERLRTLGMDAMDELQERLAENPESFGEKILTDLVNMAIVAPAVAATKATGAVAAAQSAPKNFQVVFRSAEGAGEAARSATGPLTIEGEVVKP